jgi:hypothetical protein
LQLGGQIRCASGLRALEANQLLEMNFRDFTQASGERRRLRDGLRRRWQ